MKVARDCGQVGFGAAKYSERRKTHCKRIVKRENDFQWFRTGTLVYNHTIPHGDTIQFFLPDIATHHKNIQTRLTSRIIQRNEHDHWKVSILCQHEAEANQGS